MANLDDMDLEKFRLWTEKSLKCFLSLRGKSTDGKFDELAARAFIAWEERVPVNIEAEHKERILSEEYKSKLVAGDDVFPDPLSLTGGWLKEPVGLRYWPPVYITDIASYLKCTHSNELVHQLLNEYKVGKAYRYYKCNWVKEVLYHHIRATSPVCILKCKVRPSMSISSPAYDVWSLIRKTVASTPGGEIVSAYCSCTAGMHGCCNHVAGLLFKVEEAVVTGQTVQSSTDVLCQWNTPKGRQDIVPVPAASVRWGKAHFNKREITGAAAKETYSESKANFIPCSELEKGDIQNKESIRNRLLSISSNCTPNARFRKMKLKEPPVNVCACPASLPVMVGSYTSAPSGESLEVNMKNFIENLLFTPQQCQDLNDATILQSRSLLWKEQREGRITASSFHRVFSRAVTLSADPTADATSIISSVMGYKEIPQTEAMKHGISCEPHAKTAYYHMMKKTHKKFSVKDSGIVVMRTKPYISVSPDLIVECVCCGKGLCEIKCPASVKGVPPTIENVSFLKLGESGEIRVKKPEYYAQVQGQMGVMGLDYCDFYMFTFHDNLCTRIKFDEEYWVNMLSIIDTFWKKYILPELFTGQVKKQLKDKVNNMNPVKGAANAIGTVSISATDIKSMTNLKKATGGEIQKKRSPHISVFLCPLCGKACQDNPEKVDQESVQCTECSMWCHVVCTGLASLPGSDEDWFCSKCLN